MYWGCLCLFSFISVVFMLFCIIIMVWIRFAHARTHSAQTFSHAIRAYIQVSTCICVLNCVYIYIYDIYTYVVLVWRTPISLPIIIVTVVQWFVTYHECGIHILMCFPRNMSKTPKTNYNMHTHTHCTKKDGHGSKLWYQTNAFCGSMGLTHCHIQTIHGTNGTYICLNLVDSLWW